MARKSKLEAASSNGQFTSEDFSFISGMVFIEFENLDVMFFRYVKPQALTFYTAMGQGSQVTVDECAVYLVFQLSVSPRLCPCLFHEGKSSNICKSAQGDCADLKLLKRDH